MAKFEKGENPKIQYNSVKRHLYTYFGLNSSDHIPSTLFKIYKTFALRSFP